MCLKGSDKSQGVGVWQLDWGAGALAPVSFSEGEAVQGLTEWDYKLQEEAKSP